MKIKKNSNTPQNPIVFRLQRLIDAFAKSDDERDFYIDRYEGFILYADLDKEEEELKKLEEELKEHSDRYILLPKLTFYETKKIMEGFVNEKVYDIDTKEKLLDVIAAKEAKEHFLEFIYDHESELEKWQQYYQERARIRIIEWLRHNAFQFVFEEDLEMSRSVIDKVKMHLFDPKPPKEVVQARPLLVTKAKIYYSTEALNPRPKRGRPPKQVAKVETETEVSHDIYTTVPTEMRKFLYIPEINSVSAISFSDKFDSEEALMKHLRGGHKDGEKRLEGLEKRFSSLQQLSEKLAKMNLQEIKGEKMISFDVDDEDEEEEEFEEKPKKGRKKG